MSFVTQHGQRIHYTVAGAGTDPLVVLQHGFLSNARSWTDSGVVDALLGRYRVACVDSLGHGESDKPADPARYALAERAADLIAVIDALDVQRAHVVGYSMGGWIASGVALYCPTRLSSLVVGGWDVLKGTAAARAPDSPALSFEQLLRGARSAAPDLVDWVTPEVEPGLRACWTALDQLAGTGPALLTGTFPVLLWNGRDDPYHDPMQVFAAANGLQFLSATGDHTGVRRQHAAESARGLRAFLDSI